MHVQVINVIPFNEACVDTAVTVNMILKQKRSQIDIADLFIAATALINNLPFSTLNRKHFDRIPDLEL